MRTLRANGEAGEKVSFIFLKSRKDSVLRHCEERSDEAIQTSFVALDCFATLAMTDLNAFFCCYPFQSSSQDAKMMSSRWLTCQGMTRRSIRSTIQNSTTPSSARITSAANIVGRSKVPMERCST